MSLGIIISISSFNATGQAITKHASAAQRSTIDTCRTLFVWIIQLCTKNETFNVPELLAFFLLVFGTLVYNEIVIVPIGFMRENTKAELEKRSHGKLDDEIETHEYAQGYIATSPGAMYDQNRNLRNIEKKRNERDSLIQKHQNHMIAPSDNDDEEFVAEEADNGKRY
jgi:hypothetical protein